MAARSALTAPSPRLPARETTDVGINSLHSGGNIDIATNAIIGRFESGGGISLVADNGVTVSDVIASGDILIDTDS